jgi:tetratricopeptide (TPR) repeat protein
MGAPRALALCFNFGGALEFQAGKWESAESNLRDAVKLYRTVGSAAGESLSLQRLGLLLTARGELEEASEALSEGLVVAERAAMRSHCLTRLHATMIRNRLAARDRQGLEASLAEGLEAARRHGDCVTCSALLLPEVVRALIELDRLDEAAENCARLQRTAAEFDSHVWKAMAAQCYGRMQMARGNYGEAHEALERAKAAYGAADQPYEVARCLDLQARCLEAQGAAEAAEVGARARELFAELGASGQD